MPLWTRIGRNVVRLVASASIDQEAGHEPGAAAGDSGTARAIMIQVTPQMRAIDPVDFRRGIDGLLRNRGAKAR